MASPHFPLKRKPLEKVFRTNNLLYLWKKKVRSFQKKQLLFDLYEYLNFHIQRDSIVKNICHQVIQGTYRPSSNLRVSVEKSKGLCRHLTVPNCSDALVLQALSDALYNEIKIKSPTNKAFFEKKETPFKDLNTTTEYGTLASWKKFQTAILGFSKQRNFIVVTDISNFYDCIGHNHLRNIISSICNNIDEVLLDMLIYCLNNLIWHSEYMPDSEIGLPQMDSDAPRILAHSFLYEADTFLDNKNCDFARFMDDIDIGVDTIPEAKSILRDLDITLKTRGVRLNSGKSHIINNEDAQKFFWVNENYVLDKINDLIDLGAKSNRLAIKLILKKFNSEYKKNKYSYGNGEKIIKRYIGIYSKLRKKLPWYICYDLLKNRPSVRQNLFWHLSLFGLNIKVLKTCLDLIQSGHWVDDASCFYLAEYIINSKYKNNKLWKSNIINISNTFLASESKSRFTSGLWILSKFQPEDEIMKIVRNYSHIWSTDPDLGRIIGSLISRISSQSNIFNFKMMIFKSHNREAIAALRFGSKIQIDNKLVNKLLPTLKAKNPSMPNQISHAKALLIISAKKNPNLTSSQKTQLSIHSFDQSDAAYRII